MAKELKLNLQLLSRFRLDSEIFNSTYFKDDVVCRRKVFVVVNRDS